MNMVIPMGHTLYSELDFLLAESDFDAPVVVTQYHGPDAVHEGPVDLEDAIDEQLFAGLVCI